MFTLNSVFNWGRRASDREVEAPATPARDRGLEALIAQEQVDVLYQPQIAPATGRVMGVEALARARLSLSAEELFARAAVARLDERLSRLVQRKALRAAAAWEGPLKGLSISLNVLPADISRDGYDDWLLGEVEAAGIAPSRVTVEITESALLAERATVAERLSRLRYAGLRIALDDFGTGYASLSYLTSLPLDLLKIDRSLVTDIASGDRERTVVKAMIGLARDLGLNVLVEGVESTAQLALLCEWGCDLYQGFIGAGALDEDELRRFVTIAHAEAA